MSDSAKYGQPPNNQDDWYIIRGYLKTQFGEENPDPSKGLPKYPKPPPGYVFETQGPQLAISCIVLGVVVFLVTALRLLVRATVRRLRFGLDDLFIIPATLCCCANLFYLAAIAFNGGTGTHLFDLTYAQANLYNENTVINGCLFFLTVGFCKISIVLFLRRVTELTQYAWRIFVNVLLGMVSLYTLLALFLPLIRCNHPDAIFNMWTAGHIDGPITCINRMQMLNAFSITHSILDIIILMTPIVFLWKVHMSLGRKIRVCLLFSCGVFSVIASGIRQSTQAAVTDATWDYVAISAWTNADMCSAVLIASLPIVNVSIRQSTPVKYLHSKLGTNSDRTFAEKDSSLKTRHSDNALQAELAGPGAGNYSASIYGGFHGNASDKAIPEGDIENNAIMREQQVKLTYLTSRPEDEVSDDAASRKSSKTADRFDR